MPAERLSALDASFLAVESPAAPMHIGWVFSFDPPEDGPSPSFAELAEHIAGASSAPALPPAAGGRAVRAPRAGVGRRSRVRPGRHLLPAEGEDLSAIVDHAVDAAARDRPLWEMWIVDSLPGGRVAIVGKAHHCMVDGTAVVELGNALFDAEARCAAVAAAAGGRRRRPPRPASGSRAPSSTAPPTARRSR